MNKDKLSIGVDLAHPDFTPETTVNFFTKHEATKNYRSAFSDIEEFNEITLFHIFKAFIVGSLDTLKHNQNKITHFDEPDNLDAFIDCIRKFHIIDHDILNLVELTVILKLSSLMKDHDISYLQEAIERKFLPKIPSSQNKKKASNYLHFAATYFAILLIENGASKRQSIALSCDLFGFSESFIDKIFKDVLEAKNHPKLNHYLPISNMADGFIISQLYENRVKLNNILQEFQNPSMRSNKALARNKTVQSMTCMLIEKGLAAYEKLSTEERESIQKQFTNELPEHITNLLPAPDDSIDDLITKNTVLFSGILKKAFNLPS